MARTNPFAKIMEQADPRGENPVALDYTVKGASRSLISTIDEMAAQADKLLKGETIIEVDPALVDELLQRRVGEPVEDVLVVRDLGHAVADGLDRARTGLRPADDEDEAAGVAWQALQGGAERAASLDELRQRGLGSLVEPRGERPPSRNTSRPSRLMTRSATLTSPVTAGFTRLRWARTRASSSSMLKGFTR